MRIHLSEYLKIRSKHSNGVNAMTRREAQCFGLRYPLPSGWPKFNLSADVDGLIAALSKKDGESKSINRGVMDDLAGMHDVRPQEVESSQPEASTQAPEPSSKPRYKLVKGSFVPIEVVEAHPRILESPDFAGRVDLIAKYNEAPELLKAGARWDYERKVWYIENPTLALLRAVGRWMPAEHDLIPWGQQDVEPFDSTGFERYTPPSFHGPGSTAWRSIAGECEFF